MAAESADYRGWLEAVGASTPLHPEAHFTMFDRFERATLLRYRPEEKSEDDLKQEITTLQLETLGHMC